MKKIPLTQGKFALVDDEDFEWLNQWKWYYTTKGYAMRSSVSSDGSRWLMHRLILGLDSNKDTDHINGNRLDNQRQNLRHCSNLENTLNRKKKPLTSSRYKGVSWHIRKQKWSTKITNMGKQIYLGDYHSEIESARVYDLHAKRLHGRFAKTNEDIYGEYWK